MSNHISQHGTVTTMTSSRKRKREREPRLYREIGFDAHWPRRTKRCRKRRTDKICFEGGIYYRLPWASVLGNLEYALRNIRTLPLVLPIHCCYRFLKQPHSLEKYIKQLASVTSLLLQVGQVDLYVLNSYSTLVSSKQRSSLGGAQ